MLNDYIQAAIAQAHYELLPEDGTLYGEIEGFQGVYATGTTIEACCKELMEVLEEWILLGIAQHTTLSERLHNTAFEASSKQFKKLRRC